MEKKESQRQTAEAEEKDPKTAGESSPQTQEQGGQAEKIESETPKPGEELQKKLEETSRELEKQKDLLLRTAAEYDNFRKRTAREKASLYSEATAAAVLEILTVADSLERALEQPDCTAEDMRKGVELVQRQMKSALEKLGVEEMGAQGDPFDPELHNAISHVEDGESGDNTVVKVFQKGYKIGDRVIRHAMVQVAN
ncbi:nucleotide exchange factor GrpE [Clostridium sp. W14A]|uniref:Protein GrpE n=1 Tax=Caproicibacter fermentans TaxID=2576756 RepID=A0A7G8T7L0_9FIRM|nr:nucleotide exchange factor GrpE [Caproicibacter fermentans]OCN01175.1 nucleotide exchange factor GrpE [Clostridium sp. W14A]QNK39601.1 nucleotide exchange factor GrpE [Caproicibacter fermentans]